MSFIFDLPDFPGVIKFDMAKLTLDSVEIL